MRKLLNQKVATSAKPKESPYQMHDTAIPGLVLRIQPTGVKVWKLIQNRKPRTLGRMPVMTHGMAADKASAILRGEDPDIIPEPEPTPEVFTFGKFLAENYSPYLEQNHSRPKETLSYLRAFELDDKPLDDIRLVDVETWRIKRQRAGRKPSTINRQCAALKAALQRAVDWDLLPDNPLKKLKALKIDKRPIVRHLSDDESGRLLAALKMRDAELKAKRERGNKWRQERGYKLLPTQGEYVDNLTPMILLALNTGLRRGELWNLRWGEVDLKNNLLTVHGQGAKSKQTRHIPLNATAQQALKTHRNGVSPLPSVPVFGRHEFKKSFATVLREAKIESFRFHDTRHTFASRLVLAGVPLNTVRELMGHASIDMTLIYAHLAPDDLRHAVEMLS